MLTRLDCSLKDLKFPLVTICNQNMLKRSKIMGKDGQWYLDGVAGLYNMAKLIGKMNKSFEIDHEILTNGHQFDDIVKEIKFNSSCPGRHFDYEKAYFLETRVRVV